MNASALARWFLVLALACEAFACWGLGTVAGRRAFDEMAGMVPLAAGVLGLLLAAIALVMRWRARPSANHSGS